jgi:4-hydroxythreonine-4-phosphate dehydrogenase
MILHQAPVNLVISSGEPAGIGPEISLAAALIFLREQADAEITIMGDPNLFKLPANANPLAGRLHFQTIHLVQSVIPGELNPANAQYVLHLLNAAIDGCLDQRFDAMITAPIQKSVMNVAQTTDSSLFTGHTEYLAERCGVKHVVMMLCAELPIGFLGLKNRTPLRVALVTIHVPLKEVSNALSHAHVLETIQIVHDDLQQKFGITNPVIRMAGLNPHAGEAGYLGNEEMDIIAPAIASAQGLGIEVSGPYPGDTLFVPEALEDVDAFIAMYHDQGLAPFKFVTFGSGVNVTLGLPIIRTSVDHGTALDIAGTASADASSMLEAIRLAYQLAVNAKKCHDDTSGT